jgi:hypothetical protein
MSEEYRYSDCAKPITFEMMKEEMERVRDCKPAPPQEIYTVRELFAEKHRLEMALARQIDRDHKLLQENAKLRALVERAGELDRTYVGEDIEKLAKECREALKWI